MIPVDAQIWTEAGCPPRRLQPRDGAGRNQQPRRRRQDRPDRCLQAQSVRAPVPQLFGRPCAGDRAERNAGDVFGGAVLGGLRQWRRPQPVRAGAAQGNPRSRPDGGRDAEPHPRRRHPRLPQRAGAVDFVVAGRGFFVHPGRRRPRPSTPAVATLPHADPEPPPARRRRVPIRRRATSRRRRRRSTFLPPVEKPVEKNDSTPARSRWPTTRPSRA